MLGKPLFTPDVSAEVVAEAGGAKLADLIAKQDRGAAMQIMNRGAAVVVKQLYQAGKFDGVISMGGFSEVDRPGQPFWWSEANQAFVDSLKRCLRPDIPVEVSDNDVNDPAFSGRVAEKLLNF